MLTKRKAGSEDEIGLVMASSQLNLHRPRTTLYPGSLPAVVRHDSGYEIVNTQKVGLITAEQGNAHFGYGMFKANLVARSQSVRKCRNVGDLGTRLV